jgi:hypothetical protein
MTEMLITMSSHDSSEVVIPSAAELADRFRSSGPAEETIVRSLEMVSRPINSVNILFPRLPHPAILIAMHLGTAEPNEPARAHQWLKVVSAELPVEVESWCLLAAWRYGAETVFRRQIPSIATGKRRDASELRNLEEILSKRHLTKSAVDADSRAMLPLLDAHGGVLWTFNPMGKLSKASTPDEIRQVQLRDRTLNRSGRRVGRPPAHLLPMAVASPHTSLLLAEASRPGPRRPR